MHCILFYALTISFLEYVAEIYETLLTTPREVLKTVEDELHEETPQALHSMLPEKENKEEAIKKYQSRQEKETVIYPPTCSGMKNKPLTVLGQPALIIINTQPEARHGEYENNVHKEHLFLPLAL